MGGGVFIGVIWGLIFTAFVAAVASLNTPLPERPDAGTGAVSPPPAADAPAAGDAAEADIGGASTAGAGEDAAPGPAAVPETVAAGTAPADTIPLPSGSEFNRPPPDEAAVLPGTDAPPGIDAPDAPPLPMQSMAGGVDTAPAPRPAVTSAPRAPRAPGQTGTDVEMPAQTAALAEGAAPLPPRPLTAPDPDPVATPPADRADIPAASGAVTRPGDTAAADAALAGTDPGDEPAEVAEGAARADAEEPDPAGAGDDPAERGGASLANAAPPAFAEGALLQFVAPRDEGTDGAGSDAGDEAEEQAQAMPGAETDMTAPPPRILRPGNAGAGDRPRQLPQIVVPGRADPPEAAEMPEAAEDAVDGDGSAATEPGGLPALVAHAAAFDAAETRPLLAVVLIDAPGAPLDPATLTEFSFPVAFAVDPMHPGAAERAAAYRDAGFEVLLLASAIPEGATASDTEVALAAAMRRVPEAVALIDTPDGRMQGDRAVLEAAIGAAAGAGQGMLAFPRGLNTAEQMAAREGVPAATLFRLVDGDGQTAAAIVRQLGRAEFAAVQEGAAIVAARTSPDTVTALYSWALGNRNEGVAIAPVSAVLLRLQNEG
jgi:hypothetical protein